MARKLRGQDVSGASALSGRFGAAKNAIEKGKLPAHIAEEFCPEYLAEICRETGLDMAIIKDLLAVSVVLDAAIRRMDDRPPRPKPKDIRKKLDRITRDTERLLKLLQDDSLSVSGVFLEAAEMGEKGDDGLRDLEFSDIRDEVIPALEKLIATVAKSQPDRGRAGHPLSLEHHALAAMRRLVVDATGECDPARLRHLAEHMIEPVMPPDDARRWDDLVKVVLAEPYSAA